MYVTDVDCALDLVCKNFLGRLFAVAPDAGLAGGGIDVHMMLYWPSWYSLQARTLSE